MVNGTLTLTGDLSFVYHSTYPVLCVNNLDSSTDEFIFIGEKLEAEQLGTVWLSPVVGLTRNVSSLIEYGTMNTRASYKYSPYGKIIEQSGDLADANPYRFSSEYYDKETEFVSYFYRTYRSDIGRFISRDPIGEKGGLNLYAYVGNSPVDRWDFRGQKIKCCKGKPYDTATHCCCNGRDIVRSEDIIMEYLAIKSLTKLYSDPKNSTLYGGYSNKSYWAIGFWGEPYQCSEQAADYIDIMLSLKTKYWNFDIIGGKTKILRMKHHVVRVSCICRTGDCPETGRNFMGLN